MIPNPETRNRQRRGLGPSRFNRATQTLCRATAMTALGISLLATDSQASPIIYTFSGIATGSLNGAYFGNRAFSIQVYSDTTNVVNVGFAGAPAMYSAEASAAIFTLAGLGSGQFTKATRVFDTQSISTLGFSDSYSLGGFDMWDFTCDAARYYDLASPLAPVPIVHSLWGANLIDQPTTRGKLSLPTIRDMTFSAVVLPGIVCPNDSIAECGDLATITTVVADPDGNPLTVVWNLNGAPVQTNSLPGSTSPQGLSVSFATVLPMGTNQVGISVSDSEGNNASCSTLVTVRDTTPPTIDWVAGNPALLWPPNQKLVPVQVDASVADECGPASWRIVKVTSNEAEISRGSRHRSQDWQITGDHTVLLRAQRSGNRGGRVYTIAIEATDQSGNTSQRTLTVLVPRDLSERSGKFGK